MPKIDVSAAGADPIVTVSVTGTVNWHYRISRATGPHSVKLVKEGSNATATSLTFTLTPKLLGLSAWTVGQTLQLVWVSAFANPTPPLPKDAAFSLAVVQSGTSILTGVVSGPVGGSNHLNLVIDLEVTA